MTEQQLAEWERLLSAVPREWTLVVEADGYCPCPLCDGEGFVAPSTYDPTGPDPWATCVQVYGIGDHLTHTEAFFRAVPEMVPALIAEVRRLRAEPQLASGRST